MSTPRKPFAGLASLVRNVLRRSRVDRDLDEEIASYVDHLADEKVRSGMDPARARREALVEVGGVDRVKERVREVRAGATVLGAVRDLRLAARSLARSPGLAAALLLSLALGVGTTTAAFTVVEGVLLRPLPYHDPGRLHLLRVWWDDFSSSLSSADLAALDEHARDVARVGAWFMPDDGFTLSLPGGPEVVRGAALSRNAPEVLGIEPTLGPGFSPVPEAMEVLVGEALWRDVLGGDPDAIGRSLQVDGEPFTVVGVMPAGFGVPGERGGQLWMRYDPSTPTRRGPFYWAAAARLAPEIDAPTAERRLADLVRAPLRESLGVEEDWRYGLRPLADAVVGDVRPTLRLLLAAGGLVLLVGVSNFANLLLARGLDRRQELAVRVALGAGRSRIAGQLLSEAAVIGLLAGALGLALAAVALRLSAEPLLTFVPRMDEVAIGWKGAAFAVLTGLGAALVPGAMLAARGGRASSLEELTGARLAGPGRAGRWARDGLVVAEIALCLTVLATAGLLGRSFQRLEAVDPGFSPAGVATFRISLPEARYPEDADADVEAFIDGLAEGFRTIPGVTAVGFSSSLPPDLLQLSNNYSVEGEPAAREGNEAIAEWIQADGGYFTTLGIDVVAGRVFGAGDRDGSVDVAVVNEAFVRRHFPAGSAVGRRLHGGTPDDAGPWLTIVGVVGDVPYQGGVWQGAAPTVYLPLAQNLWQRSPFVVVRTAGEPGSVAPAARRVVQDLDPAMPIRNFATMEERMRASAAGPRVRGVLFGVLAAVALSLAVTGVAGVLAHEVSRRRHETALMRALGASQGRVLRDVLHSGMRRVAAGLVLGTGMTILARGALRSVLYGVDPADPWTLGASALIVVAAAAAACAVPAQRAVGTDPMTVFRR